MNWLMTIGLKALGLGDALDAVNGETSKAYLGGLGMILAGAATLLGGLGGLVQQLLPLHAAVDYLAFAQGLRTNASAGLVLAGAAAICKGYEAIGQRHALAKLQQDVVNVPLPNAPAPAAAAAVVGPPAGPDREAAVQAAIASQKPS